mmetsp:Transcript_20975/g.25452  ORF Transcript_20975/g.25452 Transcript_20975/m.25452 type:complete len:336 (-) Transcript_20975:25-1032(-)
MKVIKRDCPLYSNLWWKLQVPEKTKQQLPGLTVKPVDCTQLFRLDADPNAGQIIVAETTSTPSFRISLHNEKFDSLRFRIKAEGEYYEKGVTSIFREILLNRPPGIVVDVGMNIGWYSLYSRAMGHSVFAFEPNVLNCLRMCESVRANKWTSSLKFYNAGVGNKEGVMQLSKTSNPGARSLVKPMQGQSEGLVDVITLDSLAQENGWTGNHPLTIHLLKVDVEGFEPQVILGAKRLLESGLVSNILTEERSRTDPLTLEAYNFIVKVGYKLHFLGDHLGHACASGASLDRVNDFYGKPEYIETLMKVIKRDCPLYSNLWWKLQVPEKTKQQLSFT